MSLFHLIPTLQIPEQISESADFFDVPTPDPQTPKLPGAEQFQVQPAFFSAASSESHQLPSRASNPSIPSASTYPVVKLQHQSRRRGVQVERARKACEGCRKAKCRCEVSYGTINDSGAPTSCLRCARLKLVCALPVDVFAGSSLQSNSVLSSRKRDWPSGSNSYSEKRLEVRYPKSDLQLQGSCPFNFYPYMRGGTFTNAPIECLRQCYLIAHRKQDLAIVGSTMSVAAQNGFSMTDLLGSEVTSRALAADLSAMFSSPDSSPPSRQLAAAEAEAAGGAPGSKCPALLGFPLESAGPVLPGCLSWIYDDLSATHGLGPACVYVMKVANNGQMTMYLNKLFTENHDSLEEMLAMCSTKQLPRFIHAEDAGNVLLTVDAWRSLSAPTSIGDGGMVQRTTTINYPRGWRFRREFHHHQQQQQQQPLHGLHQPTVAKYERCHVTVQLVVTNSPQGGQVTHHVISSRRFLDGRGDGGGDATEIAVDEIGSSGGGGVSGGGRGSAGRVYDDGDRTSSCCVHEFAAQNEGGSSGGADQLRGLYSKGQANEDLFISEPLSPLASGVEGDEFWNMIEDISDEVFAYRLDDQAVPIPW